MQLAPLGLGGPIQRLGRDITHQVIVLNKPPGPAPGEFQHGEIGALCQGRDLVGICVGRGVNRRSTRGHVRHRPRVMRGDDSPGQADIGQIAAIGVDPRIELDRRAGQSKAPSRAGA